MDKELVTYLLLLSRMIMSLVDLSTALFTVLRLLPLEIPTMTLLTSSAFPDDRTANINDMAGCRLVFGLHL
eukprot:scaffold26271_cov45-Attheya_sp.AAC.3